MRCAAFALLIIGAGSLRIAPARDSLLQANDDFTGDNPCLAVNLAKHHVRLNGPKCHDKTSQQWQNHWENCTEGAVCQLKDHPEFQSPDKLFEIITRKGHEGYTPDTLRLQQVLADAAMKGRKLKVLVQGTSVTAGVGCCHNENDCKTLPWASKLEQLASLPGSPVELEVQNLARGGNTLINVVKSGELGAMASSQVDLVIMDFSISFIDGAIDDALAVIKNLPSKPAILFLETLTAGNLNQLPAGGGSKTVCDMVTSGHWDRIKSLGIPSVSYADLACAADGARSDGKSELNYWPNDPELVKGHNHPTCAVHDALSHLVFQYLGHMKQDACTSPGGYEKVLATDAGAAPTLTVEQECMIRPLTRLNSENGFPAQNESSWAYYEDVPNKPGWITDGANYHNGLGADIVFDVHLHKGQATLEYLSTYTEDSGKATCWIEGEEQQSKTSIDALWDLKASLSNSVTLKSSARACGPARIHCRSDGKKFKILSVTTC